MNDAKSEILDNHPALTCPDCGHNNVAQNGFCVERDPSTGDGLCHCKCVFPAGPTRHDYVPLAGDVGTWCGYTDGGMTCGLSASNTVHYLAAPTDEVVATKDCELCEGNGQLTAGCSIVKPLINAPCYACQGTGKVPADTKQSVSLPFSMDDIKQRASPTDEVVAVKSEKVWITWDDRYAWDTPETGGDEYHRAHQGADDGRVAADLVADWRLTEGPDGPIRLDGLVDRIAAALTDARQPVADDLLYRMARHLRNTDEMPLIKWGAASMNLLAELKQRDPDRYYKEVKKSEPLPSGPQTEQEDGE